MQTEAAIFDLDGLLIDSEPLWRGAEMEILCPLGVPLTEEMCMRTTGLRIDHVVAHWHQRHPWDIPALDEVTRQIIARMIELIGNEGRALPGALEAVEQCRRLGLKLAVATSSMPELVDAALGQLGLTGAFGAVCTSKEAGHSKPHPAVFLLAAEQLGVDPLRCVVLEDSLHGVIAAKAARMRCIAVPAQEWADDPRFVLADTVLGTLEELDAAHLAGSVSEGGG